MTSSSADIAAGHAWSWTDCARACPYCTHGTCAFPAHDHTTAYDPDGHDISQAQPMRCRHCGQPAH
ncbi:hypothetical protein ACFHW0_18005 [Micromonospora sp. LOL_025]|uniref:hypothetical protein n=1 Tax=Micromonospora sp. LOL_025 TaxID=3345413 RepID=UPI003A85E9CB